MAASYLVRLDDALPTLRTDTWEVVENLLNEYGIKPMVAVIPNNRDETMLFCAEDPLFWERVRGWQAKGWSIGLHGFEHTYHKVSRTRSLIPLHERSEFVGLDLEVQRNKFAQAARLFSEKGVEPDLFIAPSHSFDRTTLSAMKAETGLRIISDGIALSPFVFEDVCFVPQQLWKFKWRPFGVWTICLHPNTITQREVEDLALALSRHHQKFISLEQVMLQEKWYERAFGPAFRGLFWTVRTLRAAVNSLRDHAAEA
jgi:predicted deacetylase